MTIIQSITLGIVQGITEFLPVSSSAHLVIVPNLLGWKELLHQNQLYFDIVLHFGSLLALLIYFRKDLLSLATQRNETNNNLLKLLAIGTIPVAVIALLFKDLAEKLFASTSTTAILLIITGVIIMFSEVRAKLNREIKTINTQDGVKIGFAQAIAIAPGISRSGITISAGLLLGLTREASARFSFMLAIPAVFGAFLFSVKNATGDLFTVTFLAGLLSSFVFSYIAIKFLLGYLQRGSLKVFALYCIVVGLGVLILSV